MAEITLVKGDTSALDRTWMSMPDGSTRQVAVQRHPATRRGLGRLPGGMLRLEWPLPRAALGS